MSELGNRRAAFQSAQAEYPLRGFSESTFLQACASIRAAPERYLDVYLASACTQKVPGAPAALVKRHQQSIYQSLLRMKLSSEQFEDAYARLLEILFVGEAQTPAIGTYQARGSLDGWLRVTATRAAHRILRRTPEECDAEHVDSPQVGEGIWQSTEHDMLVGEFRGRFFEAMIAGFKALSSSHQRALRQHYEHQLSIDVLAQVWQVHRATAARRIAQARALLREQVLASLESTMGISPSSAVRMIRGAYSRLELAEAFPMSADQKDE